MIIPYEKVEHLFGQKIEFKRMTFFIDEDRLKKFNSLIHPKEDKYFYLSHIDHGRGRHTTLYFDENGEKYIERVY